MRLSPEARRDVTVAAAGAGALLLAGLVRRLFPGVETRPHQVNEAGWVEADPAGLSRNAGVPLDVYALASCMQSEEEGDRGRLAVGRAVWNAVKKRSRKIFPLLAPRGRFGRQDVNPYASTARAPTARTLELARKIVEGRVPDFVRGAVQWDAPAAQDRLHALYLSNPSRYPRYRSSSADVARRRVAAGAREVRVPGVEKTRFWTYSSWEAT